VQQEMLERRQKRHRERLGRVAVAAAAFAVATVHANAAAAKAAEMEEEKQKHIRRVFYLALVPIRPRRRCELHSLRTFSPGSSLRPPPLGFIRSRRTRLDAFRLRF
jgi:hypothetical protein